jgi:hypothetical protein
VCNCFRYLGGNAIAAEIPADTPENSVRTRSDSRATWRAFLVGALILMFGIVAVQSGGSCAESKWPLLQQFTARIGVDTSAPRIFFQLPLLDVHGVTRYTVNCVGGDNEFLGRLGDRRGINYIGPFACRLNEGKSNDEDSLLSEDDSAYWYSRGQVHDFGEIIGACGRYPEYGAVRHFRLRGFELTLEFTDIVIDGKGKPAYFVLAISVRRDATALSAEAEQTGYLTPYKTGRGCGKVLRGNETRMCRDWVHSGGSWTECSKLGE